MITADGKLEIFERFRVDRNLPKYKKIDETSRVTAWTEISGSTGTSTPTGFVTLSSSASSVFASPTIVIQTPNPGPDPDRIVTTLTNDPGRTIRAGGKKKSWLRKLFPKEEVVDQMTMTVEEFFGAIKGQTGTLDVIKERAAGYEKVMLEAKENGQQALLEILTKGLYAVRAETQLLALDMPKFLDEEKLVEFARKSEKGLRLDWIANFIRIIPSSLIEKKRKADEQGVFDNYVVLHYDPNGKGRADTEEEIRKKKDPILFGVIEGKRRLYYIGDWVDEFCDLTLDKIADTLGKQAISEIPRSVVEVK